MWKFKYEVVFVKFVIYQARGAARIKLYPFYSLDIQNFYFKNEFTTCKKFWPF
jgi:hypothetical protein